MPIAQEMPRTSKQQEEAPKAQGIVLGALDRAVNTFDAAVDKGRDVVSNALDKAATKVEHFNAAANDAGDAFAAAARAALGSDQKPAVAQSAGGSGGGVAQAKSSTAPQTATAAAADDDDDAKDNVSSPSSSEAASPSKKKKKLHVSRSHHLHIKSPRTLRADMKHGMEKAKQKLQKFADDVRGAAKVTEVLAAPATAPSDAFLGPDQSPKTLEAKRLKRAGTKAETTPPAAAAAAASAGPIQNLIGAIGSAAKGAVKVVRSPLLAAGHAARTINEVLPEGTIPTAVTNLLPPESPHEAEERGRYASKFRKFAKRVKLGYYLIQNPQVLKMVAIAGGVLVVGILMGTGALIMHLVDRRMLLR